MSAFIKVCSVHTPSSNPNRKPARQLTLRRQQQQNRRAARNQRPPQSHAQPQHHGQHGGNPRHSRGYNEAPPPYNYDDVLEMQNVGRY